MLGAEKAVLLLEPYVCWFRISKDRHNQLAINALRITFRDNRGDWDWSCFEGSLNDECAIPSAFNISFVKEDTIYAE